ncbi:hypothetical protein QLH51_13100 [Sphingomonas sp. 2R-10]|uniref:hypothetical protein n=1 Tax=Sphingomonas sp. 2R-10 TaxID=3045148 RepID=UPI000F79B9AB|nr:hypothetical protein [Sphingomonas sp. 2R-10]MDJ0277736.1 hypothetical protein [Sphingomonas sp. 2R-10]
MTLALRCLPRDGSEWGQAMSAEFDLARRDGKALGFACGCLIAAWRRLPHHAEGRIAVVSHALVLGLIVPIATFHLGCAFSGARFMLSGFDHYYAMLMASGARGRILADAYVTATPALTVLLLLLGSAHLAVAWFLLDGRWRRAAILWLVATIIAVLIVHIIATAIPNARGSAIQFAALAIELAAIPLLAGWRKARAGSSHWKEA